VWSAIDSKNADALKSLLPRVLSDSSQVLTVNSVGKPFDNGGDAQVSPNSISNNMSGQHSHASSQMRWKDDAVDEVDLNEPYPYDDDEDKGHFQSSHTVVNHAGAAASVAQPTKKRSVRVTIVSRQHTPNTSSSPTMTYPHDSFAHDNDVTGITTPNSNQVMDTSSLSALSSISPSPVLSTPTYSYIRARSLSEESAQLPEAPLSAYSAGSPPPPPPDTPASSVSLTEHRHAYSYGSDGEMSPPPPPPETPDYEYSSYRVNEQQDSCERADESDQGGKTSPKRPRLE
jgi:hypothetical protein